MTTKSATSVQRLHHDRNHNPCERSQTGEPCEGNPHARFDERGEETETMVRLRGTPTRKSGNNQASQDLNVHRASPRLYKPVLFCAFRRKSGAGQILQDFRTDPKTPTKTPKTPPRRDGRPYGRAAFFMADPISTTAERRKR